VTHSASRVTVVGGGLAGVEAAWQLASRGVPVSLLEMRPVQPSPAHHTDLLGELVCSNSLKSEDPNTAAGCLKAELEMLDSIVLKVARDHRVAAGGALAVERTDFARALTCALETHPLIRVERTECASLPDGPCVIATGPLTSEAFSQVITRLVGPDRRFFYDAAAPIVDAESLDHSVVFPASRYGKGETADYLNAPISRNRYEEFIDALLSARRVIAKEFERKELFAACQPVEEVARTGRDALRFGALKPVGITDPATGERPWAVVQLRAENKDATAYNLVGFQTNLTWPEQARVFSMIPGLEEADFLRYGVMHRNTYIDAPRVLDASLALKSDRRIRFAGQVTGTEGYLEAAASGLLAGVNTYADLSGVPSFVLPRETALGALIGAATDPERIDYQPMHVNFGIVPPLSARVRGKRERYAAYSVRAQQAIRSAVLERRDLFGSRDST